MNRRSLALVMSGLLTCAGAPLFAGTIDNGLQNVIDQSQPHEVISTLVYLWEQADIEQLNHQLAQVRADRNTRNVEVTRALRDTAELTQRNLLGMIKTMHEQGLVQDYKSFWIANIIRVDATSNVLEQIAQHPDVDRVFFNMPIQGIAPVDEEQPARRADLVKDRERQAGGMAASTGTSVEAGVAAVRAPEVWNDLGYTGAGVLIATMDTGVDGNHPAVASRWRGLDPQYQGNPEWAWFDPITSTTFPTEFGGTSHGTHTMGTVVGGAPGDQIGVAPGAQWIHAGVIDRGGINATIANAILSFQWMAAPTGNPGDEWAVPHVCSNSWGTLASHGHPACDETFWQWIDNSEAAGTVQLFSAGNEGGSGLRRPADRATSEYKNVAVAAIDPHNPSWPIASFSSRGPTNCTLDGSSATKPDISAPGVGTRSAIAGGGYGSKSGTSMASPHVNGVIALMYEACPELSVDEVKQIIYDTAFDLGTPGKDNTYGYGMIDAYEAVLIAEASCGLSMSLPNGAPSQVDPGVATTFPVQITEIQENIVPGSARLFYRFSSGESYQNVELVSIGGDLYDATIPPASCGSSLEFYVQVEGDGGSIRTNPIGAPSNTHKAIVGELVTVTSYQADFQSGLPSGWSMNGLWHLSGSCPVSGDCQGSQWAYYGISNSCNYDTGSTSNSGYLISSTVTVPTIPEGGSAVLTFCYNLQTEPATSWDIATFSILGGPSVQLGDSATWTTHSMNVTSLSGQQIILQWHFDTIDHLYNNYRGWQVDNIRIEVTDIECVDPVCQGDLTGDNNVGMADLSQLVAAWGSCSGCDEDLNGDDVVDLTDLLMLISFWGSCGN